MPNSVTRTLRKAFIINIIITAILNEDFMKFNKRIFCISVSSMIFLSLTVSCATTANVGGKANAKHEIQSAKEEAPKAVETPLSLYKAKTDGITLAFISMPKQTVKGKAFSAPYILKATKADGSAAANLDVTVEIPASRKGDKVEYSKTLLTTDSEGAITFSAGIPAQSFNTVVKAYPAGDTSDAEVAKLAATKTVVAPYKAKTNMTSAGGCLAIVDYNAAGKAIRDNFISSSNLLTELMVAGFSRVGNGPDFSSSISSGDSAKVYNSAKDMLGTSSAYLIYGTVKYANPVEKTESGFKCTLNGEIVCLDMKSGTVLYSAKRTASVTEGKEWNALPNARKALAKELASAIIYGM